MAITDPTVDPMAFLVEAGTKPPKQEFTGDFKPFFFGIKDDERALIRPLLNFVTNGQVQLVEAWKHEYFVKLTNSYLFRNLCAKDPHIDLDCQICLDVEAMPETTKEEKDAKRKSRVEIDRKHSSYRFVLPVYLHAVKDTKTGKAVTYKNQDGEELPVSGPRLLEMKPAYSAIYTRLMSNFQDSDSHDITRRDFTIERTKGNDGFPVYTTTPRDIAPFDPAFYDVPVDYLSKDGVFNLYQEACPPKIVGGDNPFANEPVAKSNGAIKSAPDF